jgi:hypothetical protein
VLLLVLLLDRINPAAWLRHHAIWRTNEDLTIDMYDTNKQTGDAGDTVLRETGEKNECPAVLVRVSFRWLTT